MTVVGLLAVALPARDARAQVEPGRITGTVTESQTGQPLAGAQVRVVGTQLAAVAGGDGQYRILGVAPGTYQVRATMIGYTPLTVDSVVVAAGGAATAVFRLERRATTLTTQVVVGYGTQERRDVTGAVSSVEEKEIQQIPAANAIETIKGRVPGVDIVSSGYAPGSDVRVRIRGTRSLTATNDPLYVLDGIPMAGGLGDLNPADIASMEILKDASATAVYGSRGANGVVLITTRQGSREGGTRITYDGYAGTQQILNKVELMNGEEFAEYKREAHRAVGRYTTDEEVFFPIELASLQAGRFTDWQDEVLRSGLQISHQIGISGGNERTRFAISANQLGQEGITKGQEFTRQSMRINFDHQPTSRLRMGASTLLTRTEQDVGRGNGLYEEALLADPLGVPRDSAGNILFRPTPDGLRVNPLSEIEHFEEETVRTRSFSTLFGEYDIANGLRLRTNFGPDLTFARRGRFRGSETGARQGGAADALLREDRIFAYTLDNILSYQREIGRDHSVDGTLLYSIQQERAERDSTMVSGLPYEHQRFYNLGSAGSIEGVGSGLERWTLQSYMARLNYGWRDRYLLTLTGRVDGSSRLAPGNKYGLFPSVALGWRLSEEPFFRGAGLSPDLKLRVSFGRTGNTAIAPYQTQGSLARTTYAFGDGGAFGFRPSELPNPNLKWETTTQLDAGLDFGILNSRITGSLDFYRSRTDDLLLRRQLPPTSGFTSILENVGATQNTGFEVALSTVNIDRGGGGGFRWSTTVNWSTNRNKIVALTGGGDDVGSRRFIGQPIEIFYDHRFAGIWQLADSIEARQYGQVPGQIRVVDQNDDGQINDLDRVIVGNPFPDWFGSLSNRFDWKGFDMAVLVTARQGFMVNSQFHSNFNQLFGRYNNLRVDYWTPANPSNTNPRPNRDQEFPLYGSSRAYMDGSFVRLRNVTLGYTLPGALAARSGAQSARIYASAQDPFVFTDYDGYDPESGTAAGTPSYRTLLMGLGLVF